MRRFILVDLHSQMRYLPQEMRFWPRERLLLWMRQYGEVEQIQWLPNPDAKAGFVSLYCGPRSWPIENEDVISPESDWFAFRSFLGFMCGFIYPAPGDLRDSYSWSRAWGAFPSAGIPRAKQPVRQI
jgi:hypothetical protein